MQLRIRRYRTNHIPFSSRKYKGRKKEATKGKNERKKKHAKANSREVIKIE